MTHDELMKKFYEKYSDLIQETEYLLGDIYYKTKNFGINQLIEKCCKFKIKMEIENALKKEFFESHGFSLERKENYSSYSFPPGFLEEKKSQL